MIPYEKKIMPFRLKTIFTYKKTRNKKNKNTAQKYTLNMPIQNLDY